MINPVGWFEIYVDDMTRARQFYQAVFECELDSMGNEELAMWAFPMDMNSYGAGGALVHMAGFPAGNNSTVVYFSCEDCAVNAERAKAAGGKIFKKKFSIGEHGFIVLLHDTEGNLIGLHSML